MGPIMVRPSSGESSLNFRHVPPAHYDSVTTITIMTTHQQNRIKYIIFAVAPLAIIIVFHHYSTIAIKTTRTAEVERRANLNAAKAKSKRSPAENDDIDNDAVIDVAEYDGTFTILPINRRKLDVRNNTSGPAGVRDVLQSLFSLLATKRRKVDESKLPYKCGAILYNHNIPGQDGHQLNEWINELVQSNSGSSYISSDEHISKSTFLQTVEKMIQNLSDSNDWIIIHSNNNGLAFAADEHILYSWRDIVNKQKNCHFITTAIFVDSLEHSIKHTKERFANCACAVVDYYDTISIVNDDGVRETLGNRDYEPLISNAWIGQLDHFLFKSDNVTEIGIPHTEGEISLMKNKIKMTMNVLIDHFDLVLVDGNNNFSDELLKITGWSTVGHHLEKTPVSDKGGLLYTKELISAFGKISTKNGDADFIDAVNHVYHNSLEYLVLQ